MSLGYNNGKLISLYYDSWFNCECDKSLQTEKLRNKSYSIFSQKYNYFFLSQTCNHEKYSDESNFFNAYVDSANSLLAQSKFKVPTIISMEYNSFSTILFSWKS